MTYSTEFFLKETEMQLEVQANPHFPSVIMNWELNYIQCIWQPNFELSNCVAEMRMHVSLSFWYEKNFILTVSD